MGDLDEIYDEDAHSRRICREIGERQRVMRDPYPHRPPPSGPYDSRPYGDRLAETQEAWRRRNLGRWS